MFLYRETLQVPLFVKLPGGKRAGETVATPAALSDVFPTLAEAAGVPGFTRPEGTRSLLDPPGGPARRILSETFFPRIHFGWSDLSSLFDGRWHYVDAPKAEIYDVVADPGELHNRLLEKPDALRSMLVEAGKRKPAYETAGDLDPEARKKLASLGYLSAGPSSAGAGALDDPKDRIGTFETLRTGLGDLSAGNSEKAHAIFTKLLAENPRMLDVWDMDAKVLVQLGRPEEALLALKKTVELAPEAARGPYVREVANMCLQLGRPEEALVQAKAALEMGDPDAEEVIARAELARGDLAAAEQAARRALRQRPGCRSGRFSGPGADPGAEGRLLRCPGPATTRSRPRRVGSEELEGLPGFHYLRGDLFARMNRPAEAEKEFLAEIRVYPQGLEARVGLAVTYAATGRRPEAIRVVSEMVRDLPRPDAYATGIRALQVLQEPAAAARLRSEGLRGSRGNRASCRAAADEPLRASPGPAILHCAVRGATSTKQLTPGCEAIFRRWAFGPSELFAQQAAAGNREETEARGEAREEAREEEREPRRRHRRDRRERRERRADRSSEPGRLSPGPGRDRSRPPIGAACCFREQRRARCRRNARQLNGHSGDAAV